MNNNTPDFEKMALEIFEEEKKGNIHMWTMKPTDEEAKYFMKIVNTSFQKIWNDYVIPEKQKNSELQKDKDDLLVLLSNCRTQIEFMNDGFCNGESESAVTAVKCIDSKLNSLSNEKA